MNNWVTLYNKVHLLTLVNALTNNEQYICYSIYSYLLMLVLQSIN